MTHKPVTGKGVTGDRPPVGRPRVVAIIAAFNEADVIEAVIAHLVKQGVSVHFIDDGSTDGTRAIAERFTGRGVIGVEEMPARAEQPRRLFDWKGILSRKAALAGEIDADWFIHHDADEFRESPWPHLTLSEAIQQVDSLGYNAIDFSCLDFWPIDNTYVSGGDVRDAFTHFAPCAAYDRAQIKCWKKVPDIDLVSSGGHEARFDGRHVFPIRFLLRHYPIRGQEHGARKVFQERVNRFQSEERARGWHVQYDMYQPDASFLRDPATLTPYDPDAVRMSLMLQHRGVEELERSTRDLEAKRTELEESQNGLRRELETVAGSLQEAREQRRQTLEELSRVRAALDVTRSEVDQQSKALAAAVDQQSKALAAVGAEFDGLVRRYQVARTAIEDRDRRLSALQHSFAWRATWPARAAYDAGLKVWSFIWRRGSESGG